ncbi:MAG: hypothetical protein AVDCRST_MAG25-534, partial [uncultured Rubrobacteraceae bacterium]
GAEGRRREPAARKTTQVSTSSCWNFRERGSYFNPERAV